MPELNFGKGTPQEIANNLNPMINQFPTNTSAQATPVKENNGLTFMNTPEQILALGSKSPEEKIYIVYWENSGATIGWMRCEGRYDCYTKIGQTLESFSEREDAPDVYLSKVSVEIPVVNAKGEGVWAMTHPDKSASVYQFCKAMEGNFNEEIRFDIDQYVTESSEEGDVEFEGPRHVDISAQMHGERVFNGDPEMNAVYTEAMNDPNRGQIPNAQDGTEV